MTEPSLQSPTEPSCRSRPCMTFRPVNRFGKSGPQGQIHVIASRIVEGETDVELLDEELIIWQGGDRCTHRLGEVDGKRENERRLESPQQCCQIVGLKSSPPSRPPGRNFGQVRIKSIEIPCSVWSPST